MHEHHRHDDAPEPGVEHRLERIAESSVAIVGGRLVTPVLLMICIGLVGWIGSGFNEQLVEQGRDIAQVKSDVRVLGARLDESVLRQVESNSKRLDGLEGRVNELERAR